MPSGAVGEWDSHDLLLRMHLLREMRCGDEECLPELWRGTGAPSETAQVEG